MSKQSTLASNCFCANHTNATGLVIFESRLHPWFANASEDEDSSSASEDEKCQEVEFR